MADFNTAYSLTMKIEAGWANDPRDHGGETYAGIARNMHPEWSGWAIIDLAKNTPGFPDNLRGMPELEAKKRAFYKQEFWNVNSLDLVNDQAIANKMFDIGVNCGTGVAALFLQRVLNVTNRNGRDYPDLPLDGKIGQKSIAAVNGHHRPAGVLEGLKILQGAKYIAIAEADHTQETFIDSWFSRVGL